MVLGRLWLLLATIAWAQAYVSPAMDQARTIVVFHLDERSATLATAQAVARDARVQVRFKQVADKELAKKAAASAVAKAAVLSQITLMQRRFL